ncbi:energy-coupling factor ABC transporter substrate-binding protein [Streptococcus catagoni]|uniref:energy-coupling factor ABC transporter substrate-binding protein n=1 Tax=Streptococcus catagoni TaxID=2654874 RepID=UPI00140B88F8|nr:energy-coupling factor ABC transporter substrate-binding protein [Streptococcus catagoni]
MKKHRNLILVGLIIIITLSAFVFAPKGVEYSGTDDAAETAISSLKKDYKPWFSPIFEPAGEVESLLFTLQGSIGAGIIFYVIGYHRGKQQGSKD